MLKSIRQALQNYCNNVLFIHDFFYYNKIIHMNITETVDVSLHRSQDMTYNLKQWPVVVVCVCVCVLESVYICVCVSKRGGAQRVSDTELRGNYEIASYTIS